MFKNRVVSSPSGGGGSTVDNVDPYGDGSGVLLYQYEDDVLDTGGTYDGTPTSITYVTGEFGKAASFDGSSSLITTAYTPSLQERTLSFWIKGTSSSNGYAIATASGTGETGFVVTVNGTDCLISMGKGTLGTYMITHTAAGLLDGNRHHVIMSIKSGDSYIRIDDVELNSII